MDVWTIIRTTARRWYVSVPIIATCVGAGYVLAKDLPPIYAAQSTAILTGPAIVEGREEGELEEVNPFLSLGGALTTTTDAMVVLMDSQPKRLEYEERGLEPKYVVDRADAVLFFEVEGEDPESVAATAIELVEIADAELAALQGEADAPPAERIRVVPLSLPQAAVETGGSAMQVMAAAGGLGLVAGTMGAIALEGLLRVRSRRARPTRHAAPGHAEHPDAAGPDGTAPVDAGNARDAVRARAADVEQAGAGDDAGGPAIRAGADEPEPEPGPDVDPLGAPEAATTAVAAAARAAAAR